jgi:hypothetical protein
VAVAGKAGTAINDRLLLRLGDGVDKPLTLTGAGESFTFADNAYIRIGAERVVAGGALTAFRVRVNGSPRAIVNGRQTPAAAKDGFLEVGSGP